MDFSVVIATRDRAPILDRVLAALRQARPPNGAAGEIVVCDNGSSDQTRAVVERHVGAAAWRLRYLHEPTPGKSRALNRALPECRGRWLVFLDDDVRVDPGLFEAYRGGMERHPEAVCFGGPIRPWIEQRLTARQAWLLEEYPGCYGLLPVERDTPMRSPDVVAYGGNMVLRREAMPAGGFDLRRGMAGGGRVAGEDVAMVAAVLERGPGWLLAEAAVGHHLPPERVGLGAFWRWQAGLGRSMRLERGAPKGGRLGVPWWAGGRWRRASAGPRPSGAGTRSATSTTPWRRPRSGGAICGDRSREQA